MSVAVTVVRGGTIYRRRISTKAGQELEAMDNLSNMSTLVPDGHRNTSTYVSPLSGPGFVVFNVVLLVVVVLPVVVLMVSFCWLYCWRLNSEGGPAGTGEYPGLLSHSGTGAGHVPHLRDHPQPGTRRRPI